MVEELSLTLQRISYLEGREKILIHDAQYWYQAEDFILGLPKPEPMQKKDKKEIYQHDLSGCV